jgi:RNase P subunit RPR2
MSVSAFVDSYIFVHSYENIRRNASAKRNQYLQDTKNLAVWAKQRTHFLVRALAYVGGLVSIIGLLAEIRRPFCKGCDQRSPLASGMQGDVSF